MKFLASLTHAVVPTRRNSYRPHLLSKPAVSFFLAVVVVLEAFFIASLFNLHYFELFFGVSDAFAVNLVLVAVTAVLGILLVTTFFRRVQVQALDMLLPAVAVFSLAAFLLVFNATYPLDMFEIGNGQSAAVIQLQVIALTNAERLQNNVGVLTENPLLDAAAKAKAQDMAANGYFAHVGPDGKKPWAWITEAGYTYRYAGENLAVRFNDSQEVVNAWMNSPTHRANIVKGVYREIGVATAQGLYEGQPATYIVQYFGTQATSTK